MMGKITHSSCSDGKHRWGSESWILAEINYYSKKRGGYNKNAVKRLKIKIFLIIISDSYPTGY